MDVVLSSVALLLLAGVSLVTSFLARKRAFTRRGLIIFALAGSLLAIARIALFFTLSYQTSHHTMSYWIGSSDFLLRPENFLFQYLPDIGETYLYLIASTLLLFGSYLWVSPTLFVYSKRK